MNIFSRFTNKNEPSANAYRVGQEWHYRTRKGEENSTLKIVKIEEYEDVGKMIHIAILNVEINYPTTTLREVLHIPISKDALRNSTTQLKNDHTDLPDYEFGYVRWKTAFDEDKAGYFSISVNEVLEYLEENANR